MMSEPLNLSGPEPNRLGVAVKILGRPNLKSEDARRWQSGPHLRISLGYLEAIFDYLGELGIRMGKQGQGDRSGPGTTTTGLTTPCSSRS